MVWPWLRESAAEEIMLCTVVGTITPKMFSAVTANIIQPSVAAPHSA